MENEIIVSIVTFYAYYLFISEIQHLNNNFELDITIRKNITRIRIE